MRVTNLAKGSGFEPRILRVYDLTIFYLEPQNGQSWQPLFKSITLKLKKPKKVKPVGELGKAQISELDKMLPQNYVFLKF